MTPNESARSRAFELEDLGHVVIATGSFGVIACDRSADDPARAVRLHTERTMSSAEALIVARAIQAVIRGARHPQPNRSAEVAS